MTLADPKYVPGTIIQVYGKTYIIQEEGVLDGGEFWYISREFVYHGDENLTVWLRRHNIPEDDIQEISDPRKVGCREYYPGFEGNPPEFIR